MAERYFVAELPAGGELHVDEELAHHLGRVLRVRPGDAVRLGDGRGATATARVLATERGRVTLHIDAVSAAPPPRRWLLLAFACPRLPRVDWLIEHGTEVGVAVFQPLWCARSRPQTLRPDRWQKILRAAAGQCDRAWLPTLRPPIELAAWLQGDLPTARLLADPTGTPLLERRPADERVALLVGPEGGLDQAEVEQALAAGFAAVRYGPHILRTETAALIGAALLLA